jgi:hypothetical protein
MTPNPSIERMPNTQLRCRDERQGLTMAMQPTLACMMPSSQRVYEVRPRKDKRGVDLISDALPFGELWNTKPDDAIGYAKFFSTSCRDSGLR